MIRVQALALADIIKVRARPWAAVQRLSSRARNSRVIYYVYGRAYGQLPLTMRLSQIFERCGPIEEPLKHCFLDWFSGVEISFSPRRFLHTSGAGAILARPSINQAQSGTWVPSLDRPRFLL